MRALVVGSDYLASRFACLLKNLTIPLERAPRLSRNSLRGMDAVFFSGKNCSARNIMESLRSGCSVFSEQMLFEKRQEISLVKYAERNRLRLVIGSFDVFNPVVKEAKKSLRGERVMEAFFSRVGPKQFGYVRLNIVDDLVIQDIGIMSYLFGSDIEVASVHSRDPHNHCFARLKSGESSIFAYANKGPYYKERTLEIFGERKKLRANMLTQRLTLIDSEGMIQSLYGAGYESYREQAVRKKEPLKEAVELFMKGKRNPVDYSTLENNLSVAWEIKKAIQAPTYGNLEIPPGRLIRKAL